jgi:uncharacterized protein (DUF342 family)
MHDSFKTQLNERYNSHRQRIDACKQALNHLNSVQLTGEDVEREKNRLEMRKEELTQ